MHSDETQSRIRSSNSPAPSSASDPQLSSSSNFYVSDHLPVATLSSDGPFGFPPVTGTEAGIIGGGTRSCILPSRPSSSGGQSVPSPQSFSSASFSPTFPLDMVEQAILAPGGGGGGEGNAAGPVGESNTATSNPISSTANAQRPQVASIDSSSASMSLRGLFLGSYPNPPQPYPPPPLPNPDLDPAAGASWNPVPSGSGVPYGWTGNPGDVSRLLLPTPLGS